MDAIDIAYNDETNFLADTGRGWRKWIMDLLLMVKKEINKDSSLEININFVNEDKSHQIDHDHRGKGRPTDVVSFAIEGGKEGVDLSSFIEDPDFTEDMGNLFICINVIKRHAREYGTGSDREFGYTLIHGFLHLNGYDHIEPTEAKGMFGIQRKILEEYGLPLYPDQLDEGRGK